jgi:hypothetical protein
MDASVEAAPAPATAAVLSEEHARFIVERAVSTALSSRDAANRPSLSKAAAVRISADRRRITMLVDQQLAAHVLRDLRAGSAVAAVFSEPLTHRTLQVKAPRAELSAVTPADREYARQHFEATLAHIVPLGYPEDGIRCYFAYQPEQLVAVSFEPVAAFEQTPGPGAGRPLPVAR